MNIQFLKKLIRSLLKIELLCQLCSFPTLFFLFLTSQLKWYLLREDLLSFLSKNFPHPQWLCNFPSGFCQSSFYHLALSEILLSLLTFVIVYCWLYERFIGKESACNPGDVLHPWVRKIPREGNYNPIQYFCLGNSRDRGAWWAIVYGVTKDLDTT